MVKFKAWKSGEELSACSGICLSGSHGKLPWSQGVLIQVIDLQEQPPQNTEVNHAKSQKVKEMWY